MSYNVNKNSGYAPRQSWMQIAQSETNELTGVEGDNNILCPDRRYAQLVYQVNNEPITISGGLSATITSVGLNSDGAVQLSGDQLKVHDSEVLNKLENIQSLQDNFSTLIRGNGAYTYIMKAPVGSGTSGQAIWQIKRINDKGSGDNDIEWADGDTNFDNAASGYLSLTYSI